MTKNGNKELRGFLESVYIDTSKASDKELVLFAVNAAHGDKNEELILSKIKELLPSSACSLEAKYHGGIGAKQYVRFAYPASRYGDLAVQRLIKAVASCGGDISSLDMEYMEACSKRAVKSVMEKEPVAKAVEKRVSDLYALDYLLKNKSRVFEGTIWNVTDGCIEVCLNNSCKGVLKSCVDVAVGQKVYVRVLEADLDKETVVFEKQ